METQKAASIPLKKENDAHVTSHEARGPVAVEKPGVTARSIVLGISISVFASLFLTYDEYVIHSQYLNLSHFPLIAFICFSALLILNTVLGRLNLVRPLSSFELLTVLAMALSGSVLPAWQLTGFWLAIISSPYYFATPENRWEPYFHDAIPSWIAPSDPVVMKGFFEGLPAGERVPWEAWVVPLFWWVCLIGAITFVSACVVVALRRQWIHHERLGYPVVGVGIEMALRSRPAGLMPEFMRGKLFWAGMAIPLGIVCWNIFTYFFSGLPDIPLRYEQNVVLYRGAPPINLNIHFYALAFGFFANLEVLFSIWFFFLVFVLEASLFNRIGYSVGEGAFWSSYSAATGWQSWGAFWSFVLWVLWTARHHLRQVVRSAFTGEDTPQDRQEMLSYRTAVLGFVLGVLFILLWLHSAGMDYGRALLFTASTLVIYIGVSRIVAETGLAYVRAPMTAQYTTLYVLGTEAVPVSSLTALAFTYAFVARGTGLLMPMLTQVGKVADVAGQSQRRILGCVGLALIVALLVSVGHTLQLGYVHGAYNFNSWMFNAAAPKIFNDVVGYMQSPFPVDWRKLQFFGIGAVAMALMTFLRYRFPWWPVHPIGFTISSTYFSYQLSFSIFLAWAFKWIFLRIGDAALYRRSMSFFMGILAGWALGVALTVLVDLLWFPGAGHTIHY